MTDKIIKNADLKNYTTFKTGGSARFFISAINKVDVTDAINFAKDKSLPIFIIGGGSNLVASDSGYDGLVIQTAMTGIEIIEEDRTFTSIKVHAGEVWDKLVKWCAERELWGIENLSLIPGTAGASVIQNISAYAQEISDVLVEVEALDLNSSKITKFYNSQCSFQYRSSIFNTVANNKYLILSLILKLKKSGYPNLEYKDLKNYFSAVKPKSILEVRDAVITIRNNKLPDPGEVGSAGSFFKAVELDKYEFELLTHNIGSKISNSAKQKLLNSVYINPSINKYKVSAALLIDQCGLNKVSYGGASIYENHSLVIINRTGDATSSDILHLAKEIRVNVYEMLGIKLIPEPVFIGFSESEIEWFYKL